MKEDRAEPLFVAGCLVAIALGATVVALLLRRAFPGNDTVNVIGPFPAITGVLLLARYLAKSR